MGLMERRNCYGRNDFKKDRRGITYHIEGVASCSIDNFETVIWWLEVVPAVACFSCKGVVVSGGNSNSQLERRGASMEDLLSKIYDKVAFYEEESIQLGKEFDDVVNEILEPLKSKKTESEIEEIKELIYKASYFAEKYGFTIGVRFVGKLFTEIIGADEP